MADSATGQSVVWGFANQVQGGSPTTATPTTMTDIIYAETDPDIESGETVIDYRGKQIKSYRHSELSKRGNYSPSISGLSFPFNAYTAPHFLYSFFQGIAAESGSTKTFRTSSGLFESVFNDDSVSVKAYPHVLNIARSFQGTGAEDHELIGGVVSSITISGDSAGVLMMSVDLVGFDVSYGATIVNASDALSTMGQLHPFADFDGSGATLFTFFSVNPAIESFSITMTNGATVRNYNSRAPRQVDFAEVIEVTGEVVLATDPVDGSIPGHQGFVTALTGETEGNVLITNDTTAASVDSAGEFAITMNVRLTEQPPTQEGTNSYDTALTFAGVHGGTPGTDDDIEIKLNDNSSDSWI
jgi:hypothetical protein